MEKIVEICVHCAQRMRVPAQGDWDVTCPRCKNQWKLNRSEGETMDAKITDIHQIPGFSDLNPEQLKNILEKIQNTRVNVLLVGGTGVGKSSTINALFQNAEIPSSAKVGESANPETMEVQSYSLNNVVIWDTPGLGDSTEKDVQHIEKIKELLHRKDADGLPLIDLVFLVIDGSNRDFGSVYKIIKEVIVPNLLESGSDISSVNSRLLIGVNKIDKIMSGSQFWDETANEPKEKLIDYIDRQMLTVRERIAKDTKCHPEIVTYCAGQIYDGELIRKPYNLGKLLSFILDRIPSKKRISLSNDINKNKENFSYNDKKADYSDLVVKSYAASLKEIVLDVLGHAANAVKDVIVNAINNPVLQKQIITVGISFFTSIFKKDK